jgi:5-formyltetrahydrofolate cyclo-ligase
MKIAIGVGYDFSLVESIFAQPHNIPMDAIVTANTQSVGGRNHGA